MPFQYSKILVLGATSGIGRALAARFIEEGSEVIVTGRRKENLDDFVGQHGDRATAIPFDMTQLDKIPSFVADVTKSHPDLDCVVLNSGIQRGFTFADPHSIDLHLLQTELTTNYTSYVCFITAMLPFLQAKPSESALVLISSGLSLVPLPRCPNYCATKAALHQFALSLREQLKDGPVKIVEIFPPAVQTELHDAKHQPDLAGIGPVGMPLEAFLDEAYEGLARGETEVPVGMAKSWYDTIEVPRRQEFQKFIAFFKDVVSKQAV